MDFLILSAVVGVIFVIASTTVLIINLFKKKEVVVEEVEIPTQSTENLTPPVEDFIPIIKSQDKKLYESFISTYDDGSLKFNGVPYRPGATLTCAFGIAEGYRFYIKGTNRLWNDSIPMSRREMRWGYVRPHMGVDRAAAKDYTLKNGNTIPDPVISPFDFNRSSIIDLGNYSYGTLISLFNDKYQFEFRVAHMDPDKDIIPWSFNRLISNQSFEQGWVLGTSGNYGYSSGAHTHTEVKSIDETCEVFDILLEEMFGEESLEDYSKQKILEEYKKHDNFKKSSQREILQDWDAWKKKRKIVFANPYKFVRVDPIDGKLRTWYSSYLLFNKI